jgi:hypothetical protein
MRAFLAVTVVVGVLAAAGVYLHGGDLAGEHADLLAAHGGGVGAGNPSPRGAAAAQPDGVEPAAARQGAAGAAALGPGEQVEIPLRVAGGRLLVPVEAGVGHPVDFALNTGSMVTVLSETAAQHLGDDFELTLGGLPVPIDGFTTVPDERLSAEGATIGGMIGANTLSQYDVLVDAPGGRLVLRGVGTQTGWDGVTLSDPVRVMVLHGTVLSFDVELGGRQYMATLDLGTPMVVINETVKSDLGLANEDTATLSLGGARLPGLPVRMLDLEMHRFVPDGTGFVLVGAPLAYDCAIALSWVQREIRTCVR